MPKDHSGPVLIDDGKGHSIIDCSRCGFAHFWPKPSAEELAKYYSESFYETHAPPDWYEKEAAEEPYWSIEHSDRLTTFARILSNPRGKLLDVGSGGGWLLSYAAERGWDVLGIEPSQHMWELSSKRVPVVLGTFPDVDLRDKAPFDAVHLKLVLEHVVEPEAFLGAVHEILKPGGVVCAQVPNDFNTLQAAARAALNKPAWWVVYPVHINYFNFDSLERLLRRTGFEPLAREATYPMEWFLLQGIDYIGRDDVGRECHRQRMNFEASLEQSGLSSFRRAFGSWLANQGLGREAVVFARKQS